MHSLLLTGWTVNVCPQCTSLYVGACHLGKETWRTQVPAQSSDST